jgi:hypothetical protein
VSKFNVDTKNQFNHDNNEDYVSQASDHYFEKSPTFTKKVTQEQFRVGIVASVV